MQTINVIVKRWYNLGNTYHTVQAGGIKSGITYGYGDGWKMTLCDLLAEKGLAPKREGNRAPLQWLRDNGIEVDETVYDVKRKREL